MDRLGIAPEGTFQDTRLWRLQTLLGQLFVQAPGQRSRWSARTDPLLKSAFRCLRSEPVSEADIFAEDFKATRDRISATHEALMLMLHNPH